MLLDSQILRKQLQYSSQINFHDTFGRMDSKVKYAVNLRFYVLNASSQFLIIRTLLFVNVVKTVGYQKFGMVKMICNEANKNHSQYNRTDTTYSTSRTP